MSGAYITPESTPAIPTNIRLAIGTLGIPANESVYPNKNPSKPPAMSEGAKLPPFPPLLSVIEVANALSKMVNAKNEMITKSG